MPVLVGTDFTVGIEIRDDARHATHPMTDIVGVKNELAKVRPFVDTTVRTYFLQSLMRE
jgi:hypothetical protein